MKAEMATVSPARRLTKNRVLNLALTVVRRMTLSRRLITYMAAMAPARRSGPRETIRGVILMQQFEFTGVLDADCLITKMAEAIWRTGSQQKNLKRRLPQPDLRTVLIATAMVKRSCKSSAQTRLHHKVMIYSAQSYMPDLAQLCTVPMA